MRGKHPSTTLILTERDIARLVDMQAAIRIVRKAFLAMGRGKTLMPPKVYLPVSRAGDFRAMPAYLKDSKACGMKWVNVHPENPRFGLPTVMAVILINDPDTGFPLAVLEGRLITKLRTAAAAAVAAKTLARPKSHRVSLIGCGAQADAQIEALSLLLPVTEVNVWGLRSRQAAAFCKRMKRMLPRIAFRVWPTIQECILQAQVLVTLTPSRHPIVKSHWLPAGVHINAVGADAPGKQELEPGILKQAMIVVDEYVQAMHAGEINVPIARKLLKRKDIHASLGEILAGTKPLRRSQKSWTVFDSTGLAIHDVALAAEIVQRAKQRGIGRSVRLLSPKAFARQ
ncbi:MAG: ornithine cyclodeaminase family protein [Candidatus Omnitrophica bacterium]|nr:ornithine cyclodeaminase family protein [Candidatus Omnitrophota bacterium]MBI2174036.1 ornithine cyclodeaminase family protein [Candidatus Omnitrophota bacterium]